MPLTYPQMQVSNELLQEALKQSQGQTIPVSLVLIFISLFVSAITALWVLFRRQNVKLEKIHAKTVADLENRIKVFEETAAKAIPPTLHNEQVKALQDRLQFQEQLLTSLRAEYSHINEKRLAEAKEQVALIATAIKESTSAIETITESTEEVTLALRSVDMDVRNLQRSVDSWGRGAR